MSVSCGRQLVELAQKSFNHNEPLLYKANVNVSLLTTAYPHLLPVKWLVLCQLRVKPQYVLKIIMELAKISNYYV